MNSDFCVAPCRATLDDLIRTTHICVLRSTARHGATRFCCLFKQDLKRQCQTSNQGLPDGLFSNQKSHCGEIVEHLRMENVEIFYGHLEYFMYI
jgi:hypothetical protein